MHGHRMWGRTWLVAVAFILSGCSGEHGSEGAGGPTAGEPAATGPSDPPPLDAACAAPLFEPLARPTLVATEAELRRAVAGGGEVQLVADIVAEGPFVVTEPTVVDGDGHTISGQGSTHLFVAEQTDLRLQRLTLRDAVNRLPDSEHFSRRSGAAVVSLGQGDGSLSVVDVRFENNEIGDSGPGDLRGGALYAFAVPDVLIVDSVFVNNRGSNGGAVGGLGSSFTIVNTSFIANQTTGPGGAGALEGRGGAISLDALSQNGRTAYLQVCGAYFENNEAKHAGGALSLVTHQWSGATVTIDQSTFVGNRTHDTTGGAGGAVYLLDDPNYPMVAAANRTLISGCFFSENETLGGGGGVWFSTTAGTLDLQNTTFTGNRTTGARGMGGAVALVEGRTRLVHCTIAANSAPFHGGGVQAAMNADVEATNCLFHNNTSDRDGGFAWFHANRELRDGGGNMQFLDPALAVDSNSDQLVTATTVRADASPMSPQDNGGPTPTMGLALTSPAIDAGVDAGVEFDQRGFARRGPPDAGAFEVQ